jgi:hypothetical protein
MHSFIILIFASILAALRPPFDATNAVTLAMKITDGKFARIPSTYSDPLFDALR